MPMTLDQVHSEIRTVLATDVDKLIAVGIEIKSIEFCYRQMIFNSPNTLVPLGVPVGLSGKLYVDRTEPFEITASAAGDSLNFTFTLYLDIVATRDPSVVLDTLVFQCQRLSAQLFYDATWDGLSFRMTGLDSPIVSTKGQNPADPLEIDLQALVANTSCLSVEEFRNVETQIILASTKSLIRTFLGQTILPRVPTNLKAFTMQPPFKFFYGQEYVYVSGVPQFNLIRCQSKSTSSSAFEVELNDLIPGHGGEESHSATFSVTQLDTPALFAAAILQPDAADVVLFLPKEITLVQGVKFPLMPGVSKKDKGGWTVFHWWYAVSAAISGIPNVSIDVAHSKLNVSTVWEFFGQCGGSVEIACVEYEKTAEVLVDATTVNASLALGVDGDSLVIQGKLENSSLGDVTVHGFGWPFNDLLGWLLNRIGRGVFRAIVAELMKSVRFELLDLSDLDFLNRTVTHVDSSYHSDSLLAGIKFSSD